MSTTTITFRVDELGKLAEWFALVKWTVPAGEAWRAMVTLTSHCDNLNLIPGTDKPRGSGGRRRAQIAAGKRTTGRVASCRCGCGAGVGGKAQFATAACRKRYQRKIDRQRENGNRRPKLSHLRRLLPTDTVTSS